MRLHVGVEQPPDHPLVLGLVLSRFQFEKINAALAQRQRYLDARFAKGKIRGRWQKVRHHFDLAQCIS